MKKITEFWGKNRGEIIDSVTNIEQNEKQRKKKKAEVEEIIKKEHRSMKLLLIAGIVYVVIGTVLFSILRKNISFFDKALIGAIALELIVLGTYALIHSLIFYCMYGHWREKHLVKIIKEILVFLMLPYHLCVKGIKTFIKGVRQEHVVHLLPYYLLSFLFVWLSYILLVEFITIMEISEAYIAVVGFIIACFLIFEFFGCGKFFAYIATKTIIKSVQKAEMKRTTKINWRKTLKDDVHKAERREKTKKEWEIVKKELEYTKLYFYILLVVSILLMPKKDGTFTELLVNQFLGITTIAALGREVKNKKEDDKENL